MKRAEAAKLIKEHLGEYLIGVGWLRPYGYGWPHPKPDCPLCIASRVHAVRDDDDCDYCLKWPKGTTWCGDFTDHVNSLKSVHGKRRWINKLIVALDEWVEAGK